MAFITPPRSGDRVDHAAVDPHRGAGGRGRLRRDEIATMFATSSVVAARWMMEEGRSGQHRVHGDAAPGMAPRMAATALSIGAWPRSFTTTLAPDAERRWA